MKQTNKPKFNILEHLPYYLNIVHKTYMENNYPSCIQYDKVRKEDEPSIHVLAKALNIKPPLVYQQILKIANVKDEYISLANTREKLNGKKRILKYNIVVDTKGLKEMI